MKKFFEYHVLWDLATVVGDNVILAKTSDDCIAIGGGFCDSAPNGFGGSVLYSGFADDGVTHDSRLAVNVSQPDSQNLIIEIQRALSDNPTLTQTYTLYYVVPVPAAVWLFASALGLLGWVRRRTA